MHRTQGACVHTADMSFIMESCTGIKKSSAAVLLIADKIWQPLSYIYMYSGLLLMQNG